MSFGPTGRCSFCGGVYYIQKLPTHELICSLRPRKLRIMRALRVALAFHPEASKDRALLVRLAWRLLDGYMTEEPNHLLTDPGLILARARSLRRKRRPKKGAKAHPVSR